jgi:hypothetical protein
LNWARPRKTLGQISNLCRIQNHFSNIFRIFLNIYIPDRHPPGFFFKKTHWSPIPLTPVFFLKKPTLLPNLLAADVLQPVCCRHSGWLQAGQLTD